jgi:uncharacterized protein YcbX
MITIAELNIYPVKSCRGVTVPRGRIAATGFVHDREWLIVRSDGRFVTQREQPRLALIAPALDADTLTLSAPGMPMLNVPLARRGDAVEVKCWNDLCSAFDAGDEAAEWLATYLDSPHRLVRFDPQRRRASDITWTEGLEALNQFSDGFPWLILSEASLADLNGRLEQPLPMNRFRPNIVIAGVAAYAEDRLYELSTGEVRFRIVKSCTRCVITTTNQTTGERQGEEPMRTLRSYRFDRRLKGVIFGQNVIAIAGIDGEIAVGEALTATWRE